MRDWRGNINTQPNRENIKSIAAPVLHFCVRAHIYLHVSFGRCTLYEKGRELSQRERKGKRGFARLLLPDRLPAPWKIKKKTVCSALRELFEALGARARFLQQTYFATQWKSSKMQISVVNTEKYSIKNRVVFDQISTIGPQSRCKFEWNWWKAGEQSKSDRPNKRDGFFFYRAWQVTPR